MGQVCSKCSHPNPPEAVYCYFDGMILAGHRANNQAIRGGSQPFPNQFVFPSGQACGNFDQLATACQQNWPAAVDLLKKGFLASFLAGMGRSDLAMAAKEAAGFPDIDRGLDRFLAKLPTHVLEAPKLRVEPTDVNLGVIEFGVNRSFELHLSNLGMRLLYGSITSDCKWLTIGEAPGNPQKVFQFGGEVALQVQIRGQNLRAGNKPLEGHLLVESNGGTTTVVVHVDVPAKAYVGGVLAGATTPRQVAEKALAAPKVAAPFFESGAVAKWFAANGWTYPVQGPPASGVGAVQQFFEALGLAKAPRVEIHPASLSLHGDAGQSLQATLKLEAQEKRPVYCHAVCDQPWLETARAELSGRSALLKVLVPRVPNRPGERLQATVTVTANGNQKFKVPVNLEIGGTAPYYPEVIPLVAEAIPVVQAQPARGTRNQSAGRPAVWAEAVAPGPDLPQAALVKASTAYADPPQVLDAVPVDRYEAAPVAPRRQAERQPLPAGTRLALHSIAAVVLALFLLGILVRDLVKTSGKGPDADVVITTDPNPRIAIFMNDKSDRLFMTFGVVVKPRKNEIEKKLTYDQYGSTNSTVLKVAGRDSIFGKDGQGSWIKRSESFGKLGKEDGGRKSVWLYNVANRPQIKIQATQLVEVVEGEPIEDNAGKLTSYFDTCSIRYVLENKGDQPTDVGLRFVLDTFIGSNDGVPFTVPGQKGLVDKMDEFGTTKKMPDFIQVLEFPDVKRPGVVGFINLKLGGKVEPPGRVLLTRWPGWTNSFTSWEVPLIAFSNDADAQKNDSAVVFYWNPKQLKPGEKRELGVSYGLGDVSSGKGGKLGISVGGSFVPGGELTLVALVNDPEKGQTLTLKLPAGMKLIEGDATQFVVSPKAGVQQSPVTWRLVADRVGTYEIEVISSTGATQKKRISIRERSIF